MDVGLYREDELFTFTSPSFLESYSNDSTCFSVKRSEYYEDIRPMPEPPTNIFDWNDDDSEKEHDQTLFEQDDSCDIAPDSKEKLSISSSQACTPNWQHCNMKPPHIDLNEQIKSCVKTRTSSQNTSELSDTFEETDHYSTNQAVSPAIEMDTVTCSGSESKNVSCRKRSDSEESDLLNCSFSSTELTNFDIAEYVFEENKQTKKSIKSKQEPQYTINIQRPVVAVAGRKKIDLKAQKYILDQKDKDSSDDDDDDDDVDIETISEEENSPVLEAGDLTDLLEQFEANEEKNKQHSTTTNSVTSNQNVNLKVTVKFETDEVEQNSRSRNKNDVFKCVAVEEKKTKNCIPSTIQKNENEKISINGNPIISPRKKTHKSNTSPRTPIASSKRQILDSLPQELIDRIKESGKRKPITVIQPIPNVRKKCKTLESNKVTTSIISQSIYLDHNYCGSKSNDTIILKKEKDSGFGSSEEDDKMIINRQPTVKTVDGKLMVSLLKTNTIRQVDRSPQKKKLNLEEYKRRTGLLTSKNSSQNCSPNPSSCSSPLPEDDIQKMLKHQEKLRKMAQEVLKTAPKSEKQAEQNSSPSLSIPVIPLLRVKSEEVVIKTEKNTQPSIKIESSIPVEPPKVPENLERKVLVSFGVNTKICVIKNEDPLAPIEKLEEIKPLLRQASSKLTERSLISSVIENIPKLIDSSNQKYNTAMKIEKEDEHGEYKQVVYLEKNRPKPETKDAGTQTNISLIEQKRRGRTRRRVSSSSSCSSDQSGNCRRNLRTRKCSDSSCSGSSSSSRSSSINSDYSSRYSSRSRSRSPRFKRRRRTSSSDRDHLNAVEERRIIYVGKVSTGTTKEDLRRKFQKFGPINKISLHFRDLGYTHLENYGFITFKFKEDAHEAYELGNHDPSFSEYKISFGGRREFCKAAYSDLDSVNDESHYLSLSSADSYDNLLKQALEKLRKRKA